MAASLYYLVSGVIPTDSMSRMQHDDVKSLDKICNDVTPAMATAVTHAMEIDYTKRTRTCTEFIKELRETGWDDSTKIGPAPILPVNLRYSPLLHRHHRNAAKSFVM